MEKTSPPLKGKSGVFIGEFVSQKLVFRFTKTC